MYWRLVVAIEILQTFGGIVLVAALVGGDGEDTLVNRSLVTGHWSLVTWSDFSFDLVDLIVDRENGLM